MWIILVFSVIIIHSSLAIKNQCSQHYCINNLLKKPVEIKCTKAEEKYTALEEQNEELSKILKSLNRSFTESDNQQYEIITQLKEENENLKTLLEDQTRKLIVLENKTSVVEKRCKNMSSLIDAGCTFTAMISKTNFYSAGQTIIFDHVVTNEGNSYNASTGKFTAPRPGLYVFSVTVRIYKAWACVDLIKGNEMIGRVEPYDYASPYHFDTSSVTVTTRLGQGDVVFVRYNKGLTTRRYSLYYSWVCYFSGFLVS